MHIAILQWHLLHRLLSYENQVNYYTNYISENPLYEYAGTYADEGISGTNTKKRDEFNRMIADCRSGKIDMIITKSISRFARNTLDCLNYVRELTEMDTDFMLKTMDHIKVFEDGILLVVFLDGTEIECKNEEE